MEENFSRRFYTYSTGYINVGAVAGAATAANINISNAYDFECVYLTGAVEQAFLLIANWSGLLQIDDSNVAHTWFDQVGGVPFMAVVGNGPQPYPITFPRLVKGNTTLNVTFTQRQAVATNVNLVLNGYLRIPN